MIDYRSPTIIASAPGIINNHSSRINRTDPGVAAGKVTTPMIKFYQLEAKTLWFIIGSPPKKASCTKRAGCALACPQIMCQLELES